MPDPLETTEHPITLGDLKPACARNATDGSSEGVEQNPERGEENLGDRSTSRLGQTS